MLTYLNYDYLDLSEELAKIESTDTAEIVLEPNNKKCLLILGMLFANGVKIKILNEGDLNLEITKKSFTMMPYVWSKLGDDSFPKPDLSDVVTEMDTRVENIKRLGVRVRRMENNPIENKIFLICPVRDASPEKKKMFKQIVLDKKEDGYDVHAPHIHTVQSDMFGGYTICLQNGDALASSKEVNIYYDQTSTGSVFDLGVAYALHKPLVLLNEEEITFDENSYVDTLIRNWPYNKAKQMHFNKNNHQ